jgi:hypothetical protein
MHPNFFHWHGRSQLKPEVPILEPRWNASAKFAENLSAADVRSLLALVLFPGAEPEFAKRFSEALVKLEPTFPPAGNAEMLRVMATASVYTRLESSTNIANALALGLQAAAFPQGRIEPVCQDVMTRAAEYLTAESERIRPNIPTGEPVEAEQQIEVQLANLKQAISSNNVQTIGKAFEPLCIVLLAATKESREEFGRAMRRLAEESQFLWWLIGRRSPALNARRESLTADVYALPAAAEAAERVALLPPAASIESLLDEALAQCIQAKHPTMSFEDLVDAVDAGWMKRAGLAAASPELTPIAAILATRQAGAKYDAKYLKQLRIPPKTKIGPAEASRQYFRELMFIQALAEVK